MVVTNNLHPKLTVCISLHMPWQNKWKIFSQLFKPHPNKLQQKPLEILAVNKFCFLRMRGHNAICDWFPVAHTFTESGVEQMCFDGTQALILLSWGWLIACLALSSLVPIQKAMKYLFGKQLWGGNYTYTAMLSHFERRDKKKFGFHSYINKSRKKPHLRIILTDCTKRTLFLGV